MKSRYLSINIICLGFGGFELGSCGKSGYLDNKSVLNTAKESGLTMEVGQDFQHRVIKQGRIRKGQTFCVQSNQRISNLKTF